MSRGRRALLLALLALCCGAASAALAVRYGSGIEAGLGETRAALVLVRDLEPDEPIGERELDGALRVAPVPLTFLAPDALSDPVEALGRRPVARLPAGGVLLASQLREERSRRPAKELGAGMRPVELTVSAAAPLQRGPRPRLVDVLAAREPGLSRGPRVIAVARRVQLLDLRRRRNGEPGAWIATVALDRAEALAAIEAENFARELRLLAR